MKLETGNQHEQPASSHAPSLQSNFDGDFSSANVKHPRSLDGLKIHLKIQNSSTQKSFKPWLKEIQTFHFEN